MKIPLKFWPWKSGEQDMKILWISLWINSQDFYGFLIIKSKMWEKKDFPKLRSTSRDCSTSIIITKISTLHVGLFGKSQTTFLKLQNSQRHLCDIKYMKRVVNLHCTYYDSQYLIWRGAPIVVQQCHWPQMNKSLIYWHLPPLFSTRTFLLLCYFQ